MCRGEISRSHSALVGAAIRIAQCMGLHRDPTEYSFSAIETHVRRLLWFQLCFLDIRTCEAQGPKPGIRADDYSTQYPLNVDDVDLERSVPPRKSADRFTEMTLPLIRMECLEMHRTIWIDRTRLEKKQTSITAVLGRIEDCRKAMKEKYIYFFNDNIPIQRCARLISEVLTLRAHAMVLHRYHIGVAFDVPGTPHRPDSCNES